jgi:glycosyltransferase involved in cell wall biosynthesis
MRAESLVVNTNLLRLSSMIYSGMKQRIIFLVKSAKTPSSRIRIGNLVPYLEEKGIEADVEFIPKPFLQRHKLFKKCAEYDMVILQKRLFSWFEFCELRKNAATLAFDFDDAVYMKNRSPSANIADYHSSTRERRFRRIIKSVDLVMAANSILAAEAAKYTEESKIKIIPSSVDLKNIDSKKEYKLSSPPIIGWVGSRVTQRYLDYLAPQLCELRKQEDFILKVISDKDFSISGIEVENVKWTLEGENCEISKFDIGIMPLSADPFSEGKASYKLLQYMAAGIPSVASAVGMNKDVADNKHNCINNRNIKSENYTQNAQKDIPNKNALVHNKNALLADNPDEFVKKITMLLKDCDLRKNLGQSGRKLIEKQYSRDVIGAKFAEIISETLQGS